MVVFVIGQGRPTGVGRLTAMSSAWLPPACREPVSEQSGNGTGDRSAGRIDALPHDLLEVPQLWHTSTRSDDSFRHRWVRPQYKVDNQFSCQMLNRFCRTPTLLSAPCLQKRPTYQDSIDTLADNSYWTLVQ